MEFLNLKVSVSPSGTAVLCCAANAATRSKQLSFSLVFDGKISGSVCVTFSFGFKLTPLSLNLPNCMCPSSQKSGRVTLVIKCKDSVAEHCGDQALEVNYSVLCL